MRRSSSAWVRFAGRLGAVERWLLPAECLVCQGPATAGDADPLVCGVCRSRWRPVPPPCCGRCGQPLGRDADCRICDGWPPQLALAESAVWLDQSARRVVHLFKYDGWWRLADGMALAMRGLAPLTGRPTLVPVPLGPARERTRGYNQSERLASGLARITGCRLDRALLERTRDTATQTRLTPEARAANVRGAFVARRRSPPRAVLVDDVFTTGATLVAAAAALVEAGAEWVGAVTFARAELPLAATSRALAIHKRRRRTWRLFG